MRSAECVDVQSLISDSSVTDCHPVESDQSETEF